MSIFQHAPATWTNDTPVPNAATFNLEIKEKMTDIDTIMSKVYPIGSIYITTVATNPATVLGFGTWEVFGAGKTLVGLNAAETEFNTVEETGGEKTHTLSAAEMPAHKHPTGGAWNGELQGGGTFREFLYANSVGATGLTGGGGAHNNLPPYITVYFFKRTA